GTQRRSRVSAMTRGLSNPRSIAHVSGWKPRARTVSRSGATKLDSCRRAVSICHATGRSVWAQTAAWTRYPKNPPPLRVEPAGRRAAEGVLQAGMLRDQRGNARPRGEREQGLDEASADERAGAESLTPTAARRERVDERRHFGGVEKFRNVANSRATRYLARC